MPNSAVLFDVDGTLLDSNYLHVIAWQRALSECGVVVPAAAVHSCIGASTDLLLDALLGPGGDEDSRGRARECHRARFVELAPELQPLPGARELLEALAARGVRPVLATSAGAAEVPLLLAALGVEHLDLVITDASDVAGAKPRPDVFEVAMARAGSDPGHAVAVGDTVWDITAATRAGIGCVGVLSGGRSAADLRAAGALSVHQDTAELLHGLDTGPLAPLLR